MRVGSMIIAVCAGFVGGVVGGKLSIPERALAASPNQVFRADTIRAKHIEVSESLFVKSSPNLQNPEVVVSTAGIAVTRVLPTTSAYVQINPDFIAITDENKSTPVGKTIATLNPSKLTLVYSDGNNTSVSLHGFTNTRSGKEIKLFQ